MALDERFALITEAFNQYLVDKDTGLPLSGGRLDFFQDANRLLPKDVYEISGYPDYTYPSLGSTLTLSASGTILNNSGAQTSPYYFPYDGTPATSKGIIELYYIACYNSSNVLQWTAEARPNLVIENDPANDGETVENQISNPQFTETFLNVDETIIYTVTDTTTTFAFAPDWDFDITAVGTGTVTVTRTAQDGNTSVITNPPYYLEIVASANVITCELRQRFDTNSGLWSKVVNSSYLGASITARSVTGTTQLTVLYNESTGGGEVVLLTAPTITDTFIEYQGSEEIPDSTNTDKGVNGYIDIIIRLIGGTTTRLTSLMIAPTAGTLASDYINYNLRSAKRDRALMLDYYLPLLKEKTIKSYLVGWDFPLNPAQWGLVSPISQDGTANKGEYIVDQTIMGRATNDFTVARNSVTNGLQMTSTAGTTAFYMLQYLDGPSAQKILTNKLSVNVVAHKTDTGAAVNGRIYLYRGSSSATFPVIASTGIGDVIINLAADGTVTRDATTGLNWTEIPRSGLDVAKFTVKALGATLPADYDDLNSGIDYGFSHWEVIDGTDISDSDKFAIVVAFEVPDTSTVVTVDSISLVPGNIATRPARQTADEVQRECEFYYEASWSNNLGKVAGAGYAGYLIQEVGKTKVTGTSDENAVMGSFGFNYKTKSRTTTPTITLYAAETTTPTAANVRFKALNSASAIVGSADLVVATYWNLVRNEFNASYDIKLWHSPVVGTTLFSPWIQYHYKKEDRIGI